MGKVAIIFPGQGSQYVGMGSDFYQGFATARAVFEEADSLLNYSLSKIIFEGPEEELRLTTNTQPAILTTSLSIWRVLKEELGITADYVAGHSLGEYSSLVAANSLSFHEALLLVRNRGLFMEEAVPNGEGTMAAIMGIEEEKLKEICDEITEKGYIVNMANINTPNQIVISGTTTGVELAGKVAKEQGAKRAIPLSVSGPFHSTLMKPAMDKLQPLIEKSSVVNASIPVVMNVTGSPESDTANIKSNLIEQVISPVQWTRSIETMVENGVDTFIEVGPGKVLTGLVKKINKDVITYAIEDIESFNSFKEEYIALKGGSKL